MAEVTTMRNNAMPYPVYSVQYVVTFPILDADGDFVTGATNLDSEISLNGDTFADCANEATEIATNSGMYYLVLTSAEMSTDVVSIIVKTDSAGAKTTPIVLYPRKLVPLLSGTSAGGNTGFITLPASGGTFNDRWNGMLCVATIDGNEEARLIRDYDGSTKQASVQPDWNIAPDSDDTFVIYLPEGHQISADPRLPFADADAAGGLPISDAGGLALDSIVIDGLKDAGVILSRSTIETVNSPTEFVIPATDDATDNDAYNGALAVIIDGTDPNQRSFRLVTDYVAATRAVTISAAADFTVTNSDTLVILAGATSTTVWDRILSGATHNIASSAGRRLRGVQAFGDYANGALWFDSVNGVGGQVDYENATVQNPSNSLTDLMVIAGSLNMVRIQVAPGSTLTLDEAVAGFTVMGENWTLALASQNIAGTYFHGADVSGISAGAGASFDNCHIGNISLAPGHITACGLEGTITAVSAGTFFLDNCHSGIAGTSSPVFDFGAALNASNVNYRHYSGGIEIQNMGKGTGNYNMSLEGDGQLIINANSTADGGGTSTVAMRGNFTVTDNAGGVVTLSDEARFDVAQITGEAAAIPSTALFTGITVLADWLGAIAGKAADAGTLAEINATTAGATYDNTSESLEQLHDSELAAILALTTATFEDTNTTLPASLLLIQNDLDTITGADGVTLATAQGLYAPSKAGDAMDLVANAVDATSVATGAIDADALAADAVTKIAKGVLLLDVSTIVGGTTAEDAAKTASEFHNLTTVILGRLESSVGGVTWAIRKTDGSEFVNKTITSDAAANPTTGVT